MNYQDIHTRVFKDKVIQCVDCGKSFAFTSGEQAYFASKGLSEPKRCKPCRELRKSTLVREPSSEDTQ